MKKKKRKEKLEFLPSMTYMPDRLDYHFHLLTGKYKHFCMDWDGLPIDERSPEWPCGCVWAEAAIQGKTR